MITQHSTSPRKSNKAEKTVLFVAIELHTQKIIDHLK